MDDGVLEEVDIEQAVRSLKGGRAGGTSVMRADDLKGWLREASRENNPVRRQWKLLVRLINRMLKDGVVPEEVTWVTMVFLPNGRWGYWGIGLVEVVWKVCASVVNCGLNRSVSLHDTLIGFREGMGTVTAILEAKLAQQLEGITHKPLLHIF